MGKRRVSVEEFWAKVDASAGPDACWPWTGGVNSGGYGNSGRRQMSHREAYRMAVGPIGPGVVIRHTCDNPPCCNPAHLLAGTQGDNIRDAITRGRFRYRDTRGERNGMAKVTVADIAAIRAQWPGRRQVDLAAEYGLNQSTISAIVRGRLWPPRKDSAK